MCVCVYHPVRIIISVGTHVVAAVLPRYSTEVHTHTLRHTNGLTVSLRKHGVAMMMKTGHIMRNMWDFLHQ